jgi:hypothetical protein
VITDLPPPGGPIAAKMNVSSILLNGFSLDFLSYHPLWSRNYLTSSSGG